MAKWMNDQRLVLLLKAVTVIILIVVAANIMRGSSTATGTSPSDQSGTLRGIPAGNPAIVWLRHWAVKGMVR